MTLPVYHFALTVDNCSGTQQHPPPPFQKTPLTSPSLRAATAIEASNSRYL